MRFPEKDGPSPLPFPTAVARRSFAQGSAGHILRVLPMLLIAGLPLAQAQEGVLGHWSFEQDTFLQNAVNGIDLMPYGNKPTFYALPETGPGAGFPGAFLDGAVENAGAARGEGGVGGFLASDITAASFGTSLTLEALIHSPDPVSSNQVIVGIWGDSNASRAFFLGLTNGHLRAGFRTNTGSNMIANSYLRVEPDRDYYVALTVDEGTDITFYLKDLESDGSIQIDQTTFHGQSFAGFATNSELLRIGTGAPDASALSAGTLLDEVRVSNRALNPSTDFYVSNPPEPILPWGKIKTGGILHPEVRPTALYHNHATYATWVDPQGWVGVLRVDHRTGAILSTPIQRWERNDHTLPSILIREPDKRVLLFWTGHNRNEVRWVISEEPEDIRTFGEIRAFDAPQTTYTQNAQLMGEGGRIYIFYRSQNRWLYRTSDDGAETFGPPVVMLANYSDQRPRIQIVSDAFKRIHIQDAAAYYGVWHFYYEDGALYQTDGTLIREVEDLPVMSRDELSIVYDHNAHGGYHTRGHDIALDAEGRPYSTFDVRIQTGVDHRHYYARWTGSEWLHYEVAEGGSNIKESGDAMSGGLYLNHDDPSIVYSSQETSPRVYEIFKLQTFDGGQTWVELDRIVGKPNDKNFRPNYVRNYAQAPAARGIELVWCAGHIHDGRTNYSTDLWAYPVPRPFRSWIRAHPSIPEDQRGPQDKPYGAGTPNIVAYALGTSPGEALPAEALKLSPEGLSYRLARHLTGWEVLPEHSRDLRNWESSPEENLLLEDWDGHFHRYLVEPGEDWEQGLFWRLRILETAP